MITTPTVDQSAGNAPRRILILSTTAFTLLFAVWLMFGVLGVPIREEFKLNQVQFSWLTAIAILSGSLWRLPFGILTDRIGGRVVMTGLLLFSAVPCVLVSHASSFTELMVYAFLFGMAGNSFSSGIAWNSAWFDKQHQGIALGTFGAGNVGASLTKLIGPALIALVPATGLLGGLLPGGWRFVPMLYAGLLVLMAVAVWFLAPSPDRRPGQGRALGQMLAPLKEIRVWRFGLYYVAVFGAYVALSLWLPSYYKNVYGLPLSTAALLTCLFIFPASLLRPLGGWLSDRYGARPVTYAVFVGMLIACLPLSLPAGALGIEIGPVLFTVLVVAIGVGMGVGKASVYKYIPEYFPRDVGAVGGLVGTLGALGGFVLPLAFAYLNEWTHMPQSTFIVLSGLIAFSLCWLHLVVVGIKRREATTVAETSPMQTA